MTLDRGAGAVVWDRNVTTESDLTDTDIGVNLITLEEYGWQLLLIESWDGITGAIEEIIYIDFWDED